LSWRPSSGRGGAFGAVGDALARLTGGHSLLVVTAAALLGCGGEDGPPDPCPPGLKCGEGAACVDGLCVPRAPDGETCALEVRPRADKLQLPGRYQFASTNFPSAGAHLVLEKVSMTGAVQLAEVKSVQVVLSFPSVIPGLAELRFEQTASGGDGLLMFEVDVPRDLLARPSGRAQVLAERSVPPWTVPIVAAETLAPIPPPPPSELLSVEGQLLPRVDGEALPSYRARAVAAGVVLTNEVDVDRATGRFALRMQKSLAPKGTLEGVSVELLPMGAEPLPRLVVEPLTATLPPIRLPPFRAPAEYEISVLAKGGARGVPMATVYFRTQLPGTDPVTAIFEQRAQTDEGGKVRIALIPGAGAATQRYFISVAPLANAGWKSACVERLVASQTGGEVLASIELEENARLTGTITRADGVPEAEVKVRAVRQDEGARTECGADLRPREVTQTTSGEGRYTLQVDPGTYRLEYLPPARSASPPWAEDGLLVTSSVIHDVALPASAFVEGEIFTPDGAQVASAELSCHAPAGAPGARATLRGSARTDARGRFRMVLPAP
jgi:hypothetical protein